MLSVIKTAIITIVISFISGVLLDTYKNVAPRILCSISNGIPMKRNNSRIKVYILNIKNTSKKTIHNLSINIQGIFDDLKVNNAKTRGLKFDSSKENGFYNINIPFMIKNDEFCAELIVEENNYADNEPVVTLRSPDNFKEVRSRIKGGSLKSARKRERSGFSINSKAILAIAALFLAVYVGVTAFEHLRKTPVHISNINEKSNNDITVQNPNNESGKKQNTVNNDTSNSKASEGKKVNQTNGTDKINTDSSKKQEQSNVQVKQSEESGANKTETDTENNNTETNTANPENTSPDSTPDNSDTQNQNESPVEQQTNGSENKDTQTGLAE